MVNEKPTDPQQRLKKFLQAVEAAQKLQDDILKYGLDAAYLYVEDIDGDWLEKWGKDEDEQQIFIESITTFLKSNDCVAVRVRKQLKDKSLPEIAIKLEKYLSFPEEERIFAVKNMLVDSVTAGESNSDSSDENDKIDLLDLAESLLERLAQILKESCNR